MKKTGMLAILIALSACQHALHCAAGTQAHNAAEAREISLVRNGAFAHGLSHWRLRQHAQRNSNLVTTVSLPGDQGSYCVLRIENPLARLIGVEQTVDVSSGRVYRLSGAARSTVTNDSSILFGARIGFSLSRQPERQIIWMSEFTGWWKKELVFTNHVDGKAIVFADMGYGSVASTGEFTDIRFERIKETQHDASLH